MSLSITVLFLEEMLYVSVLDNFPLVFKDVLFGFHNSDKNLKDKYF